jgi:peptide/nickel transport system ATP-binding protein
MAGTGSAHLRENALLRIDNLVVEFPAKGNKKVKAVSGISLDLLEGETLGLVGESGCGKSTTGRAIMQLPRPTSGVVRFEEKDLAQLEGEELRRTRRRLQMIFQDPISSLNPRRKIRDIIGEPIRIWGGDQSKVDEVLAAVGMDPAVVGDRRPYQLSGGQCQRISIARALVMEPKIIICDEPVSSLDVSVQAQILNLLEDMKRRYQLTLIFIAHDLSVVKNISDRIAVMYLGKLCEVARSDDLYNSPHHPYTVALLTSIPEPNPDVRPRVAGLKGELPSPIDPPSGCRFRTRCDRAQERCAAEEPLIRAVANEPDHFIACHFPIIASETVRLPMQ